MIYIFIALIFYTLANLLVAAAARSANTNLAAAATNIVAATLPIAAVVPILSRKTVTDSKHGIILAVLGGAAIGIFTMAISKSYALNKVGIVTPIVFGGAILLSALAGYFIFKEKISVAQGIGIVLIGAGIGLVIYARMTGR